MINWLNFELTMPTYAGSDENAQVLHEQPRNRGAENISSEAAPVTTHPKQCEI